MEKQIKTKNKVRLKSNTNQFVASLTNRFKTKQQTSPPTSGKNIQQKYNISNIVFFQFTYFIRLTEDHIYNIVFNINTTTFDGILLKIKKILIKYKKLKPKIKSTF